MNIPHLHLYLLQGKTGSGKTEVLRMLQQLGVQVIDLEYLANHRGSIFGTQKKADTNWRQGRLQQQIEDYIYQLNPAHPIIIEWKGVSLGDQSIPAYLKTQMDAAPGIYLQLSKEQRIQYIFQQYNNISIKTAYHALYLLRPRLEKTVFEACLNALNTNRPKEFIKHILTYYDNSKNYQLVVDKPTWVLDCHHKNKKEIAYTIKDWLMKEK